MVAYHVSWRALISSSKEINVNIKNNKKYFGFTLAEVLITLGIIGVVAAITIPALINNYRAARLKSQFLKSYSTIQQVFKRMQDDEISTDPKSYIDGSSYYKIFANYLAGASVCASNNPLCYKTPEEIKFYTKE